MPSKVTLNERGVITIPAQLRQAYGLKAHDELILEDTGAGILLRPSISVPIEIYTDDRIAEFARDETAIGRYLPGKSGPTRGPKRSAAPRRRRSN
jgi:AbrB family looped-hinge helix DNA binding protein